MKNKITKWYKLAIFFLILIYSCKKEFTNESSVSSDPHDKEFVSTLYNPFGVYVAASAANQNSANTSDPSKQTILKYGNRTLLAKDYGVKYMRMMVNKDDWKDSAYKSGFLFTFGSNMQSGLKIILNVNSHPIDGKAYPYPDATDFSVWVKVVLDSINIHQLKPELVVVENEETNGVYHLINYTSQQTIDSSLQQYVNELSATINVCKNYTCWDGQKGIKVTNGGFTTRGITFDTWNWLYYNVPDTAAARKYALNSMSPVTYNNIYTSLRYNHVPPVYIQTSVNMSKFLQSKYQTLSLNYTNIHWYEPAKVRGWVETVEGGTPWSKGVSQDSTSKTVLETSISYFTANFTPKVVSNAIGQLTTSSNLTTDICTKVLTRQDGAFYYACLFDGDGADAYDAKALHNTIITGTVDSYTKRPSGNAFKKANAKQNN